MGTRDFQYMPYNIGSAILNLLYVCHYLWTNVDPCP